MLFITGPLYSGKRTFAKPFGGRQIYEVQTLAANAESLPALADELAQYDVVTATEVGGGVVPIDPAQRAAREAAGRLACLLAEVLALGVLTACSGLGSVNTGTDAEKAAELAQQLRVAYAPELDNTAKAVAEWFVQEPDSLRVSGLDLVYTVALDADSNMSHTDDLNYFLYWSGCYGVPDDVTVALLLDDSTAMTAQLYAPQADSAAAELLKDAAGHSELGAAFIDYNGTAYVVAVFR